MAAKTVLRINDQEVLKLINNAELRRKFPFLATAYARMNNPKEARGGCCGAKKKGNAAEYENIRKSIGQLPADKKAVLRDALGVQQIEVRYTVRKGKKVIMKF